MTIAKCYTYWKNKNIGKIQNWKTIIVTRTN